MPDGLDDLLGDNDSTPDSGQSGRGLRAQLEAALARERALSERFEQLAKAERTRAVEGLFAKHGIPELARDFFPADAEPTDEVATSFVSKYGALWGASAQTATTTPATQAATTAVQQFAAQAAPPPATPMTEDDYRAKFEATQTRDEFLALLNQMNGGTAGA